MFEFLFFIGMIIFLISIVGIAKGSIKFMKVQNRKQSGLVLLASFIFMIIIAGFIETEPGEKTLIDQGMEVQGEVLQNEDNSADGQGNDNENANGNLEKNDAKSPKTNDENEQIVEPDREGLEQLKVHFIDVGQADSALIQYSDKGTDYNILIDSGNWNSNAAVNYLKYLKVKDIDLVVGTHPHSDHIGQIDNIIKDFNVDEVWMSGDTTTSQVFERVIDAIASNDLGYNEPRAGEEYEIGPLQIEIVSPKSINGNLNNGSIGMKLTYGAISFLFTGDAEKEAELAMVNSGLDLSSTILKVGHHGSDTSSTSSFVAAVNPKVAIISVGKSNQYGHPDESVINTFKNKGVELYSTKDNGTVIVETDGANFKITTKQDGNVTPVSTGASSSIAKDKPKAPDKKEETTGSNNCININTANVEQVQKIIHIGPERSKDLIDKRPYNSVSDLTRIKGIGPARIKDIESQGLACVK